MCTLTIVPKDNHDFVLTQNRDEAPEREALVPDFYTFDNTTMLFPKDKLAGGTWIGISDKKRVVCVLNGGFVWHERKPGYRMSRGRVANDLMLSSDLVETIDNYSFREIEPFTIVIVDWNVNLEMFELVWDGGQKHFAKLPLEARIWSSSTLYSKSMKQEREDWFESFKAENSLDAEALHSFHKTAGKGNIDYGVIMDRGFVKTTSITQIEKQQDVLEMRYEHLKSNTITTKSLNVPQVVNG